MKRKIQFVILYLPCLLSISHFSYSQNLVPNPDFEIFGTVPCGWTGSADEFAAATNDWTSPTQATPDIFSTLIDPSCSNYQPYSTSTCNGHQSPQSGNIFAGFYSKAGDWKEYVQVQLIQPMEIGHKYKVSMYVSLADNGQFATNNIGVGFSTTVTNYSGTNELGYAPQINFSDVIDDTSNWVYLSDTIVPTAAWQYIIIGNFYSESLTNIVIVNPSGPLECAYYYVDDVSVKETSPGSSLLFTATDTSLCKKFCTNFFDQSSNDPTSWQWIFPGGDPSSSTDQNPTNICYDVPGVYDVTLITTNANGSDTLTLNNYITVYPTPAIPTITQNGYTLTSSPADFYQWQLDATDIPGATNQSYEVLQNGFYTVIVSDSNSCKNSTTQYVEITGIDEVNDGGVSIYPNPSSGNLFVEFTNEELGGEVSIDVVNSLSQKIYSSSEIISSSNTKKEINLSSYVDGIYFIEVKSSNIFLRKKIILSK